MPVQQGFDYCEFENFMRWYNNYVTLKKSFRFEQFQHNV